MELMVCPDLAVPMDVMQHVVRVESSYNPYAIGVVGGRLQRQPANLPEALATVRMLESRGFNFSLGLAQVNRYNLARYGLTSYEQAFQACPNLQAGSRILAECYARAGGDWGKSFSCYYSGNFVTGYRHGYVQKVFASMGAALEVGTGFPGAIGVVGRPGRRGVAVMRYPVRAAPPLLTRRTTTTPMSTELVVPAGPPAERPAESLLAAAVPATQPAPVISGSAASAIDAVAVLEAGGRPPRLLSTSTPSTGADAVGATGDKAFVF